MSRLANLTLRKVSSPPWEGVGRDVEWRRFMVLELRPVDLDDGLEVQLHTWILQHLTTGTSSSFQWGGDNMLVVVLLNVL